MNKRIKIVVKNILGNSFNQDASTGYIILKAIKEQIEQGKIVTVSFEDLKIQTSYFFKVSIGDLYEYFNEDQIQKQLRIEHLSKEDADLLKIVMQNAKKYFTSQKAYDEAWKEYFDENI